jgi:hypothetical protein
VLSMLSSILLVNTFTVATFLVCTISRNRDALHEALRLPLDATRLATCQLVIHQLPATSYYHLLTQFYLFIRASMLRISLLLLLMDPPAWIRRPTTSQTRLDIASSPSVCFVYGALSTWAFRVDGLSTHCREHCFL